MRIVAFLFLAVIVAIMLPLLLAIVVAVVRSPHIGVPCVAGVAWVIWMVSILERDERT